MQELTFNRINKLLEKAKAARAPHEAEIREAYQYTLPEREFLKNPESPADRVSIYDTTAVDAVQNLVTNAQRLLIPQAQPWASIVWQNDILKSRFGTKYAKRLKQANTKLFQHFSKSNFHLSVGEALSDGVVCGTFAIQIMDEIGQPLEYLAVPIDQLLVLENDKGHIDTVFREHRMKAADVIRRFSDTAPKEVFEAVDQHSDKTFQILEAVIPCGCNDFIYSVWIKDSKTKLLETKTALSPFIVARWKKVTGNVWGSSPTRSALGAIRVVNAIECDVLTYGNFVAQGLWQTQEANINVDVLRKQLVPGAIIPTTDEIKPIQFTGSFQFNFEMANQAREQIRRLLHDTRPPSDKVSAYGTDQVISWFREEFMRAVGEPALRLSQEFLMPLADQVFKRLALRGEINVLTPQEVMLETNGEADNQRELMTIDVNAAIARVLKMQEAQNGLNALAQGIKAYGPQAVASVVKLDEHMRDTLVNLGLDESYLRSEAETKKIREDDAAMQQQKLLAESLASGKLDPTLLQGAGPQDQ